ncbi:putative methyltransferase [Arthrobacter globiformis NBRC 12137]|uniref:Putative methyltransferase n=1 Tax=Arthrobacter globiformis (strain ATCC 8010 / DSM 20124 / JCM 1332 / NBRC 12137 / NCIMB 8907 / NRRL B-2979 / 168) TaxID=1077972 RepID=H0QMU4_ARTG1|nr:methyltransferase domain-containing protein [Arthrobacter globiformis]GAB14145.1 putative methyltransferase [Arthrobacter globiformis NBRC 12137]
MLSRLPVLLCPVCRQELQPVHDGGNGRVRALACPERHSFDAARQGYFNLLVGKGTAFESDTAEMVAARTAFLDAGHYRPLADALAKAAGPALNGPAPTVLDSGTGTGHYLRAILDYLESDHHPESDDHSAAPADGTGGVAAVGLDISKFALRRAAKLNPEAINLVGDVWQPLPLHDAAVDVVTVVFAPRNAAEFARVLKPSGRLIVVTPRAGHLGEIARQAGMLGIDPDKDERLAEALAGRFSPLSAQDIDVELSLSPEDVANLALMGPAGHHTDRATLTDRLAGLPQTTRVSARFRISIFVPLEIPAP